MKLELDSIYYFGCFERSGHFLFNQHMNHIQYAELRMIPAVLMRRRDGVSSDDPYLRSKPGLSIAFHPGDRDQTEGRALLHHLEGWTVLSFWDRSVDRRGGSHSTFFIKGTFSFKEAVDICREHFSEVWERYKFPIVEVQT